jgi:hypothetical protein
MLNFSRLLLLLICGFLGQLSFQSALIVPAQAEVTSPKEICEELSSAAVANGLPSRAPQLAPVQCQAHSTASHV